MKSAVSAIALFSVAFTAVALVPPGLFLLHRATEMPHHLSLSTRIAELFLATSLVLAVLTLAAVVRALHRWWEARRNLRSLPLTEAEIAGMPVLTFPASAPLAFASGFFRPRIYISTAAQRQLSPGQLHAAVLHEHAHVEFGDTSTTLVLAIARGTFGRVPLLGRLIDRQSTRLELRADARALESGAERRDLFEAIVRCAASPQPSVTGADIHLRLRTLATADRPGGFGEPGAAVLTLMLASFTLPVVVAAGAYAWLCEASI